MATNAKPFSLNEFKGSDQEEIVKKIFRVITTNPAFIPFINLEIHRCNAEDGTSFSDAYITLRTTYDCSQRRKLFPCSRRGYTCGGVATFNPHVVTFRMFTSIYTAHAYTVHVPRRRMATNAKPFSLNEFKGSDQEEIVKKIFRVITTNPAFIPFINLEIHRCNAEDGTSFSDAYITLRTTYDCMRRRNSKFVIETIPECEVVGMRELLNKDILEQFCESGVDATKKNSETGVCQSFLTLLNFLREIESHEGAIGKLIDTNSSTTSKETQIMTRLAHHLFSQLVPNKMYEVNACAKQLPETCVCGCNSHICGGDGSLGSQGTWHGRVDIMVNHTVAVAFGKKPTEEDEDDDTDEEEPQKKQRNVETDKDCDIRVEVKGSRKHDSVLLNQNVMKQILAEAITNGFAQVNKNRSTLSNFLIPMFGVTSEHISICLYDPENDCLLHIDDELELWASRGESYNQLDPVIIIVIWLFLNFTIFTKKNLASEANQHQSGLHKDLKDSLQYYRETKTKANFFSLTPIRRPWKLANKKFKQRVERY